LLRTIELSDEATQWLIANGYDELMGARPMARVIQEHIKKTLADEVLFAVPHSKEKPSPRERLNKRHSSAKAQRSSKEIIR
jgi:ATP-dependent Clp protease ATP-binding subunit ClpA